MHLRWFIGTANSLPGSDAPSTRFIHTSRVTSPSGLAPIRDFGLRLPPAYHPGNGEKRIVSLIPQAAVTRRGLAISAAANGLAFVAQLAAAFVLAPLMLRYFGRERYGVWSFVESFLAYFTLFDLGI